LTTLSIFKIREGGRQMNTNMCLEHCWNDTGRII
jgi:hypothetical protein